jgi:hypothetical protein
MQIPKSESKKFSILCTFKEEFLAVRRAVKTQSEILTIHEGCAENFVAVHVRSKHIT